MVQYCPNCGNEVGETDRFCKSCGQSLAVETKKTAEIKKSERPISITIAAIITALSAVLEILLGLIVLGIGLLVPSTTLGNLIDPNFIGIGAIIIAGIGLFILVFGIIDAAVAYGLWKLKKWAGILGIILNVVGLFITFLTSPGNLAIAIAEASLGLLTIILIVLGWNSLE